jgi:hypothetical protein
MDDTRAFYQEVLRDHRSIFFILCCILVMKVDDCPA